MPELIEIESFRQLADATVGRTVSSVQAPDDWYVKGESTPSLLRELLTGSVIAGTRRIGKLLLVDTDGPVLGLRFGMTGRLLVDGRSSIEALEYSSDRNDPAWDRFGLTFADGSTMVVRDPRRLGGVELDVDESRLGPDASTITLGQLRKALDTTAPLKARLLDQSHIAGLGNLLVDETLWRAGIAPGQGSRDLSEADLRRLQRQIRRTVAELTKRGGSHTGDLQPARVRGGLCPKDATPLRRETIGGRTTYWCSHHQGVEGYRGRDE